MVLAYPNKHYEGNDKRLAAKRAAPAPVRFGAFLYHEKLAPKGLVFSDEAEFKAALKEGWSESPDFAPPRKKKKSKKG